MTMSLRLIDVKYGEQKYGPPLWGVLPFRGSSINLLPFVVVPHSLFIAVSVHKFVTVTGCSCGSCNNCFTGQILLVMRSLVQAPAFNMFSISMNL